MGVSADYLVRLLDRMRTSPIHEIMRRDEIERGRLVIRPGDAPWFSASEWEPTCVASMQGDDVRLIAILARRPGEGAFRRLIASIVAAGKRPVVVAPSVEMRATLKRWGWRGRTVGRDIETEERWTPRPTPSSAGGRGER